MLKAIIEQVSKQQNKQHFPCVMKSIINNVVVLFNKQTCGIVIFVPEGVYEHVGYMSNSWKMESFKPIDEITITFKETNEDTK